MTVKLNDGDLHCFAVDEETAVISIGVHKYVVDYSTLMDFLLNAAQVAAEVENRIPSAPSYPLV